MLAMYSGAVGEKHRPGGYTVHRVCTIPGRELWYHYIHKSSVYVCDSFGRHYANQNNILEIINAEKNHDFFLCESFNSTVK